MKILPRPQGTTDGKGNFDELLGIRTHEAQRLHILGSGQHGFSHQRFLDKQLQDDHDHHGAVRIIRCMELMVTACPFMVNRVISLYFTSSG